MRLYSSLPGVGCYCARQNSRVPGALLPIQRSTQSVHLPRRVERGRHVDQCTRCTPVNHQTVQRPVDERKRCRLFANLRWGSFSPVFIPSGMTWRDVVRTTDADLYVDRTTIVRTLACGAEEAPFASGLRLGGGLFAKLLLCLKLPSSVTEESRACLREERGVRPEAPW